MSIGISNIAASKGLIRRAMGTAVAAGLLLASAGVYAYDPVSMAPPVEVSGGQAAYGVNEGSVFNWTEIPENQEVTLTRASFDKGGYQLYDTAGETIIVPFSNENLYVMKFGQSNNGAMYFVNTGGVPVLYVPANGYLDNATTSGGRWYPFSRSFRPAEPVYLGIAPSWQAYIGMGWYPNMHCWGSYYSNTAFVAGAVFLPMAGLFFEIGNHPYYGWGGYRSYYRRHPVFYHVGYVHRDFYRWANRPNSSMQRFAGGGRVYYAHRPFAGAGSSFRGRRAFTGAGTSFHGRRAFTGAGTTSHGRRAFMGTGGASYRRHGTFSGGGSSFRAHRTFTGAGSASETRHGMGRTLEGSGGGRATISGHSFGGAHSGNRRHGSSDGNGDGERRRR